MKNNPYPDPNFCSNKRDETACIKNTLQYGNFPNDLLGELFYNMISIRGR